MKKSRFTEEQIAFALKQVETGTSALPGETIGNLNIPTVLEYRANTSGKQLGN